MMSVPMKAIVLHQLIRGLDAEIQDATERGEDVAAMRAERKRLVDECMVYLNQAVSVKRARKISKQ